MLSVGQKKLYQAATQAWCLPHCHSLTSYRYAAAADDVRQHSEIFSRDDLSEMN